MQTSLSIRTVGPDHLPALKAILSETGLFPPELLDEMIANHLAGCSDDYWFTAERRGNPVSLGYCAPERMTSGTWNLLAIAVSPAVQRQGVGTAMLRHLEDHLRANGGRVLIIETMGTPDFLGTRQFYERNGFVHEATIREFYEPGGDKAVFWKHL